MDVLSPAGCVIFHNEKNELASEGLVGGEWLPSILFSCIFPEILGCDYHPN